MNTEAFIRELHALAAMIAQRPDLTLEEGASSNASWSFNWGNNLITLNPADLRIRSMDFSRGLIVHEAGHAAITRAKVIPPDLLNDSAARLLFNVIEDCRLETWAMMRWPGCRPWIEMYNNELLEWNTDSQKRGSLCEVELLMSAILFRWWSGHNPPDLTDRVREELEAIWPDLEEAISLHPDPHPAEDPAAVVRAYRKHPASICFRGSHDAKNLDAAECGIRMKQYEMWRIVADRILPRIRRLNGGAYGDRQCASPFARRFASFASYDDDLDEPCSSDPNFADPNARVWNISSTDHDEPPQKAPTLPGCEAIYSEAESRLQPEISQLADTLIRELPKETNPRYRNAYPSGQRISLSRAMKAEADPRELERIWDRRNSPGRPDPAFVIAADVSSSMRGPRAEATFNAIVIIRECCLRLNIPLGIVVFSDRAWIAQDWCIPRDRNVVPALCRLKSRPRGNTKIAKGIEAAARTLSSIPCRNRHLWLISDGNDNRNQHVRKVIRDARNVAQTITGLGLGPETDSMKQILPDSIVNLNPEHLPHAVASLLTSQIHIA